MKFDDYIAHMNRLENKLGANLHSIYALNNRMVQACMPILESHNSIAQSIHPLIEYQEHLSTIIKHTFNIPNVALNINPHMENFISIQQDIATRLANWNLDFTSTYISAETSIRFSEILDEIIDDIDDIEIPDVSEHNFEPSIHTYSHKLTWEQVITIIAFILTVISLIQSNTQNAPTDPQLNMKLHAIETNINKLLELQIDELNSLDDTIDQ